MSKKKKTNEKVVDPYTGEEKPPIEDAEKYIEVVPVDTGDRKGKDYLLREETSMDTIAADEDADAVARKSTRFTEDEQVEENFEERQHLAASGRKELEEELDEYNAKSPKLSGGDIDAAWEDANAAGEETVGGTTPTPDQDVVEELGEALGITYEDDEPLSGGEKMRKRDRERWELDPRSADTNGSPKPEDEE